MRRLDYVEIESPAKIMTYLADPFPRNARVAGAGLSAATATGCCRQLFSQPGPAVADDPTTISIDTLELRKPAAITRAGRWSVRPRISRHVVPDTIARGEGRGRAPGATRWNG